MLSACKPNAHYSEKHGWRVNLVKLQDLSQIGSYRVVDVGCASIVVLRITPFSPLSHICFTAWANHNSFNNSPRTRSCNAYHEAKWHTHNLVIFEVHDMRAQQSTQGSSSRASKIWILHLRRSARWLFIPPLTPYKHQWSISSGISWHLNNGFSDLAGKKRNYRNPRCTCKRAILNHTSSTKRLHLL